MANAMLGPMQFAKYINAPIVAKYGISGPKYFTPHHMSKLIFLLDPMTVPSSGNLVSELHLLRND